MTTLNLCDVARALGISKSQAARESQHGMPLSNVAAARSWRLGRAKAELTVAESRRLLGIAQRPGVWTSSPEYLECIEAARARASQCIQSLFWNPAQLKKRLPRVEALIKRSPDGSASCWDIGIEDLVDLIGARNAREIVTACSQDLFLKPHYCVFSKRALWTPLDLSTWIVAMGGH